ncbi:hypothetical protein DTL21_22585 [Bremerella cremea]|uniref:VOC domain-containing protein n=1 Tax=Blastopirellula marina TaxID=124 RepID=A0A2S8FFP5_9BACT|nr:MULTISPECIES: VOC family protein [Pirellulaceae]PQO30982.1 hypothetical protein C5Y83_22550 [Blastopirellula marina]RCS44129.1 hypothetical protein DTL21_22585 [Bremerella cremea]
MELFAVEIRTAQWETMLRWYTSALRMDSRLRSEEDGYALLTGEGWRLSLLQLQDDQPRDRSAISLAIEVEDLEMVRRHVAAYLTEPEAPIQKSDEGFIQWTIADPDGNRIKLFQFER